MLFLKLPFKKLYAGAAYFQQGDKKQVGYQRLTDALCK